MADGNKSRRDFVRTAAQMAVTAPAAVMLLSASTKPAKADEHNLYTAAGQSLDDPGNGNGDLGGIHGLFGNTIFDDPGGPGVAN